MEACWRRLVLLDGELRWCARRCAQMCGVCARVSLCARFRACVSNLSLGVSPAEPNLTFIVLCCSLRRRTLCVLCARVLATPVCALRMRECGRGCEHRGRRRARAAGGYWIYVVNCQTILLIEAASEGA